MILLKSKLSARETRTVVRDKITTVTNQQQLKRTHARSICTRQLFKIELFNVNVPLRARLIRN